MKSGAGGGGGGRRGVCAALAATASILVLLAVAFSWRDDAREGGSVVLDSLNPFGSVQDVQLPDALGQPPTLSHLFHTSYGPGFNAAGQAVNSQSPLARPWGAPRPSSSLSYVGPVSVGPLSAHLDAGEPDPAGYDQERAATYGKAKPFFASGAPARPAWETEAHARSEYWRALDDFYAANEYASYAMWLMHKRQMSATAKGQQQALLEVEETATGDKASADRRLGASRYLVESLGEGPRWRDMQNQWDFFFTANQELDSKQQGVDKRRAELLAQATSAAHPGQGVYVSSYVPPWRPLRGCRSSKAAQSTFLCKAAKGIPTPQVEVGFTSSAKKAASSPAADELQGALDPLNAEQARLNKARMLLYVREFGPLKQLLEPAPQATKLYYPGDFEMPKVTDCDDPGHCHDWTNGQYIDNFAGASTNWDLMGSHQAGYMHWDSLPGGDAPAPRPGQMPFPGWKGSPRSSGLSFPEKSGSRAGAALPSSTRGDGPRTEELAMVSASEDYTKFDWGAFNRRQAAIAGRARAAARILLSPAVQSQPLNRLLLQSDPFLETRIPSGKMRTAVGGMGTWAETHDPSTPPKEGEGFAIPPGMPFGGGGATRSLGGTPNQQPQTPFEIPDIMGGGASRPLAGAGVKAKKAALQAQLQRVEGLMNREWGKGEGMEREMNRPSAEESQKEQAERAARASEKAMQRLLGAPRVGGGEERKLARPVVKSAWTKAQREASEAAHNLLEARQRALSDDPESRKERAKERRKVAGAERQLEALGALGGVAVHVRRLAISPRAKTAEGGRGGRGRGGSSSSSVKTQLLREEAENRRLKARLASLGSEGAEERAIAEEVARKLGPAVVQSAAQRVAAAVGAKARVLRTHTGRVRQVLSAATAARVGGQVREHTSTTYRASDRSWKPHYFNRAFWSQLSHYFAGDREGDHCTQCVGDFMTATHDIRLPTGAAETASPKVVPMLCQPSCKRGVPLEMAFPHGHNFDSYGGGPDPVQRALSPAADEIEGPPDGADDDEEINGPGNS